MHYALSRVIPLHVTSLISVLGHYRHDGQRTRLSGRKQLRMFVPQAPVCPHLTQTDLRYLATCLPNGNEGVQDAKMF